VIVIGLDPGTAHCGFAVLDHERERVAIRDIGTFETPPHRLIRERVDELAGDVAGLIAGWRPACVVVESPLGSKQAKQAAMLWAAYGVIAGACAAWNAYLASRSPDEWRGMLGLSARGKLREGERKREIRAYCKRVFPTCEVALVDVPAGVRQHAFDALAISCCWAECAYGAREAA